METDVKVVSIEKRIARLMNARRIYRGRIKDIGEQIDRLEVEVRLRKVEILNETKARKCNKS